MKTWCKQSAHRVSDLILRSTRYEMLRNDRDALYNIIQEMGSEPGIQRIRISQQRRPITFSTDPKERNQVVDKSAEQCFACHAQSAPLAKLNRRDRARIFTDRQGQRVLASSSPSPTPPECSNAACHVHPRSQSVLGVIDTDSLARRRRSNRWPSTRPPSPGSWSALSSSAASRPCCSCGWWCYRPVKDLDRWHAPRGGRRPGLPPAGPVGRRTRRSGRLLQQDDRRSVAGVQAHIEEQVRRKTAELERVHKTLLQLRKDGLHRQTGRHRGA